ncbi:MAG: hypothetical protein HY661_09530 [Betaproteobacteria bacterium]|nr:hypothetical protein [Betaproteobacteria bacterium]
MNTDSKINMLNGLDKVRMSKRERAIAKAYLQKVEGILDFVWPAGAKISRTTGGRSSKNAGECKPGNA